MNKIALIFSLLTISTYTFAYIGPGMGGGALLAIFGFFAAIILALWGILYYPIKRFIKRRKNTKDRVYNSKEES